jgi:hypothetical protein
MDKPEFDMRIASELGVEAKEILRAILSDYQRDITLDELNEILSTTVKHDNPAKAISFLGMLVAQTEEDQYNVAFQAESSTGKSYIPLELANYFPKEDQLIYASASPTSFYHETGQWDKERRVITVNLESKILIFMDQPHWSLMERLRPLLSHDRKVLVYKITDKTGRGGLRTKTVEIVGYPTVVFCTAKSTLEDQERTRLWFLSPETSQEKLSESLHLLTKKYSNPDAYREWLETQPMRKWLKIRIESIRRRRIRKVVITDDGLLLERFTKGRTRLAPRVQRDYPRFIALVKAIALLNCFNRASAGQDTIIAAKSDIDTAFQLYESVALPNELGLAPQTYEIYEKVLAPLFQVQNGVSKKDILKQYVIVYGRTLPLRRLKEEILPALESAGLVQQEQGPDDRREMWVYCTDPRYISQPNSAERKAPSSPSLSQYVPDNSAVPSLNGLGPPSSPKKPLYGT